MSIVVAIVIVITLGVIGVIGLLGGELYARHRATSVLAKVVECVAEDSASVSFGGRPLLLQLMTGETEMPCAAAIVEAYSRGS